MRYLFALLGWALVAAPCYAQQQQQQQQQQQEKISIYQIQDNFIATAVAYNMCGSGDAALKTKFGANLEAIAIRVAMQAREDHPDQPDQVLAKAGEERLNSVKALVTKAVNVAGCDSDYARKMLKLYEFHANWNMYARPNQ